MIANKPPSHRCPQCGHPVVDVSSQAMPFCSERCQQIDLGRWLGEQQGVPYERDIDEFDEELDAPWNDDTDQSSGVN